MYSCKRAAQLASIELDRRLSLGERLALSLHRALCRPCRAYKSQLGTLRRITQHFDASDEANEISMDGAARQRIRDRLAAAQNDH